MILIVGLGNPGKKYQGTRHNVGFEVLDKLAAELGASFSDSEKFESETANTTLAFEGRKGRTRLLLVKPQTYMNLSGDAVLKILKFYKLRPEDQLWVVHDDLDIEIGTLRIRLKGSSAGQKGIQSIIDRLGTNEFTRFRIGIKPTNGRQKLPAEDFVLKKFASTEKSIITEKVTETSKIIIDSLETGIMNTSV